MTLQSTRPTEFQVVESADATSSGGIGMQNRRKTRAVWHSEFFSDFSLRRHPSPPSVGTPQNPLLDNQSRVASHLDSRASAFLAFKWALGLSPTPKTTRKLPLLWRALPGKWLTLKLKEDIDTILSADKEFAGLHVYSERESTKRALQQAKSLKVAATVFAIVILGFVLLGILLLLSKNPQFFHR